MVEKCPTCDHEPPTGDVIEQAAQTMHRSGTWDPETHTIEDWRFVAQVIAAAGLLRAPVEHVGTSVTVVHQPIRNEWAGTASPETCLTPGEFMTIPVPPPDDLVAAFKADLQAQYDASDPERPMDGMRLVGYIAGQWCMENEARDPWHPDAWRFVAAAILDSDVIRELLAEAEQRGKRQMRKRFEDLQEEHRKAAESWDRQRERLTRPLETRRQAAAQSAAQHACGAPCTSEGGRHGW